MDGVSMQDAYFGGDILAAGTLNADFQVIPNKSGNYTGTLAVSYTHLSAVRPFIYSILIPGISGSCAVC